LYTGQRQILRRGMHGILSDLTIVMKLLHAGTIQRALEVGLCVACRQYVCAKCSLKAYCLPRLYLHETPNDSSILLYLQEEPFPTANVVYGARIFNDVSRNNQTHWPLTT